MTRNDLGRFLAAPITPPEMMLVKSAFLKAADVILTPVRMAPLKFALVKSAPLRSAPLKSRFEKSQPVNLTPAAGRAPQSTFFAAPELAPSTPM